MPRTKISKSAKRNREASSQEGKIREFELNLEGHLDTVEQQNASKIGQLEEAMENLIRRTNSSLLQMTMGEFFELNLSKFSDWNTTNSSLINNNASQSISNITRASSSILAKTQTHNPNDEGYLTEDSNRSGSATSSTLAAFTGLASLRSQQLPQHGRTPGPLNSARARRPRRSRSSDNNYLRIPAVQAKNSTVVKYTPLKDQAPRSAIGKTPMSRAKAHSADRSRKVLQEIEQHSPPTAFMRWPKPGEIVLSKFGSPVVAQVLPDNTANVNIPVRNGILSLRPKKISELKQDIIESIDPETLKQIKTLHANLNMIVNMAENSAKPY